MENKDKVLKEAMSNSELSEFVSIEEGTLSEEDSYVAVPDESLLAAGHNDPKIPCGIDIIQLALYYVQGFTNREIGEKMGVSTATITQTKATPKFKQALAVLNHEIVAAARTFLSAAGLKAVKTLITCLDSYDDRVKLQAASQVLDRIGLKNPDQIEIIQKGDKLNGMSEAELLNVVQLGMKEIVPHTKGD